MPTASEAAAILRKHFGFGARALPDDPESGVGDPTGAVQLGGRRTDRQHELEDQFDTALRVGDRGEARYRGSQLGRLNHEIADDPFTGEDEQDRISGIGSVLDRATMTQRPEVADAAKTLAERNAFAQFLKTKGARMGELEANGSPEALRAAEIPLQAASGQFGQDVRDADFARAESGKDADLTRQQKLRMSPQLVPGQMPIGAGDGADLSGGGSEIPGYSFPPNMKPLGADAEKAIRSMRQVAPMLGELERTLDPSQAQIPNSVTSRAKWGLYGLGIAPTNPADQARLQLASLIGIAGSAPYLAGSRNYEYLKQVQKHLTDPKATDQFLYNQVQELKKLWPSMQREIMKAHISPDAPLDFGDGRNAPITDPNRGR